MMNWSILLGEKFQSNKTITGELFKQLDKVDKGAINKKDYVDALKEDPYLFNWFSFFSDLEEHFRRKAKTHSMMDEHFGIELELIKAIRSFKEISDKVKQALRIVDLLHGKRKAKSPLRHVSHNPSSLMVLTSPPSIKKFIDMSNKSIYPEIHTEMAKEVFANNDSNQLKVNNSPFLLPSPLKPFNTHFSSKDYGTLVI